MTIDQEAAMRATCVAFGLVCVATAAVAADGIDIRRGGDSSVYGNCVPSLVVENRSPETIDYLQIDVVMALRDGRQRTIELTSGYRQGAPLPIPPGATATLKQQLDMTRALGVPCGEVGERRVSRTICETAHGTACASSVFVQP